MRIGLTVATVVVGVCAVLGSPAPGLAASGFDGAWNVVIVCGDSGDVKGYTWRFAAEIRNGVLSGKYVNPNDAMNFGLLSGTIGAGGDAQLTMSGSTGPSAFNVHHEAPHTKIHYTAAAHFDARSGSGKRNEQRSCDLSFAKS